MARRRCVADDFVLMSRVEDCNLGANLSLIGRFSRSKWLPGAAHWPGDAYRISDEMYEKGGERLIFCGLEHTFDI